MDIQERDILRPRKSNKKGTRLIYARIVEEHYAAAYKTILAKEDVAFEVQLSKDYADKMVECKFILFPQDANKSWGNITPECASWMRDAFENYLRGKLIPIHRAEAQWIANRMISLAWAKVLGLEAEAVQKANASLEKEVQRKAQEAEDAKLNYDIQKQSTLELLAAVAEAEEEEESLTASEEEDEVDADLSGKLKKASINDA